MYISILGRQPSLGMAEIESLFVNSSWFGSSAVIFDGTNANISRLGGSQKIAKVISEISASNWSDVSSKIVQLYYSNLSSTTGRTTLGISAYGFKNLSPRDVQKTGIVLKSKLKSASISLRLVPNTEAALSSATSHHNKLGLSDNKKEIIVVNSGKGKVIIAESIGSQNITAYAKRDQARPKRDAFVGMLPPKLAQIMINLAVGVSIKDDSKKDDLDEKVILDPFCGTGVILQEAALLGLQVYGTDLAEKMIDYSESNLKWLADSHRLQISSKLHTGDAMTTQWQQPIDLVATEAYLGQPFSAPPSPTKLTEVMGNCEHIISSFLRNISSQLSPGTSLCVAVPAWRRSDSTFSHLPVVDQLGKYGFKPHEFKNVSKNDMLYYREDQVVARELLVFTKI